jgi:hypothetical protein
MRKIFSLAILSFVLAAPSYAQQRVFDWTRANDESVQLDPAAYHTGRVYHPVPEGGNIRVDIEARQPLTIAMVWSDKWNSALQYPELMRHSNSDAGASTWSALLTNAIFRRTDRWFW